MPADEQLAFEDASGGMNGADLPHRIGKNQLARLVNCGLVEKLPTTRPGIRILPIEGGPAGAYAAGNFQGSTFFAPSKGQGGIVLSEEQAMIALAATGSKYLVHIRGRRGRARAEIVDVTNGLFTNSQLHLVWWGTWENLLLAQDGQSNCFVYDGGAAFFSNGYNTIQKSRSQVPNGGTVMSYVHGRGVCTVNSRFVLVSDSLHEVSQSTSRDLLKFVNQTYWATGKYFLPPSKMGHITAMEILPLRNTTHGHGDLMVHCEDGVFSIDLNVYPRSAWNSTPMVKHALLGVGAVGPYAVAMHDGDQIFRTSKGIQKLRSAAAEPQIEGNPNQPFSHEVHTWLAADYSRWLRFASLVLWDKARRFLCTTQPIVQGRYRWHRGVVSRNVDPKETEANTPAAWEGLWTFPPQAAGIMQLVSGSFDGEERVFAWVRGNDGVNRLAEIQPELRHDVLEDGSISPIRSQVITRVIDAGQWWKQREFVSAKLFLRGITEPVRWGVWVRTPRSPKWYAMRAGQIDLKEPEDELLESAPRSLPIPLGKIPDKCEVSDQPGTLNVSNGIQFLIRWQGYCQLEGLKVKHGADDQANDDPIAARYAVVFENLADVDYNDFEYSESTTPVWTP
jgi:hypothetical protein